MLFECWATVVDGGPTLFECWATVVDGGPTFKQHWIVRDDPLCGLSVIVG